MSDEFKNYHIIDLQNGNALISRKQQLTASQKPLQSDEIAINVLVDHIQQLKQQLEEAVEVIEDLMFTIGTYTDLKPSNRAHQFLAKCTETK